LDQKFYFKSLNLYIEIEKMIWKKVPKAEMRQSFSTCVYCMQLRFKVITLVWANQRNFFENATTCSKRMRKTLVATQLYRIIIQRKVIQIRINTFLSYCIVLFQTLITHFRIECLLQVMFFSNRKAYWLVTDIYQITTK